MWLVPSMCHRKAVLFSDCVNLLVTTCMVQITYKSELKTCLPFRIFNFFHKQHNDLPVNTKKISDICQRNRCIHVQIRVKNGTAIVIFFQNMLPLSVLSLTADTVQLRLPLLLLLPPLLLLFVFVITYIYYNLFKQYLFIDY